MVDYFNDNCERLRQAGLDPIPISPGSKALKEKGWQSKAYEPGPQWEGYGLGHRTHTIGALDADINNEVLAEQFRVYLKNEYGIVNVRIGLPPKFALWIDNTYERKKVSRIYKDQDDRTSRLEFLGVGQQLVTLHIHPDTGKPYIWTEGDPLVGLKPLPRLDIQKVMDDFDTMAEALGLTTETAERVANTINQPGSLHPRPRVLEPLGDVNDAGFMPVKCPFKEHKNQTGTYYAPPSEHNNWSGGFKCNHPDCEEKTIADVFGLEVQGRLDNLVFVIEEGKYRSLLRPTSRGATVNAIKHSLVGKQIGGKAAIGYLARLPSAEYAQFNPELPPGLSGEVFNTYLEPERADTGEGVEVFLEFMESLVPNEEEREITLDWMAHKVQRPWLRLHGLIMVAPGIFGAGRGTLGDILGRVLGNYRQLTFEHVMGATYQSQYNAWMSNTLLALIAETAEDESYQAHKRAYERLKDICDPSGGKMEILRKGEQERQEPVYVSLLFATNHADALVVPKNDRRLIVVSNPQELGEDHPIHEWNDIQALYDWLIERECQSYTTPQGAAPHTPSKDELIEVSEPTLTRACREVIELMPAPVFTVQQMKQNIVHHVKSAGESLPPSWNWTIERSVIPQFAVKLGRFRTKEGRQVLWGVRGVATHDPRDVDKNGHAEVFEDPVEVTRYSFKGRRSYLDG